jgi:uncharacterized repeat protein (TIGR03803 family)
MKRIVDAFGELSWGKRAYAAFVVCVTTAMALPGQTLTTLHSFNSTDGLWPFAGLVQGTDGNLYGTTYYGGTAPNCAGESSPCGTIFKITPAGTLTSLHNFDGTDGANPQGGLVLGADGSFYGTTFYDGEHGGGTIFKITASGALTTLYSLGFFPIGSGPESALIQATDGSFYGTTIQGFGTILEFNPGGAVTTFYSFSGTGGNFPQGSLVEGIDGNFYGTTEYGGNSTACPSSDHPGGGTIFKITPSGALTTLHTFDFTDGAYPEAALMQAIDGNLYGTTSNGGSTTCFGSTNGCGTVFEITPSGTLTVLHTFEDYYSDGAYPSGRLLQATDGNLYGTNGGGVMGGGTIFKISPSGNLTTVYNLGTPPGPLGPVAGLVQATNGIFYGTTLEGGTSTACYEGCGTVFSLSVGLGPFVRTQPIFGKAGAAIKILGTDLTGTTSVSFNGTPASFSVVSATEIMTTVPLGAITGYLNVVTPSGTLSSGGPFFVR